MLFIIQDICQEKKQKKRLCDVSHTARWSGSELHLNLHHARGGAGRKVDETCHRRQDSTSAAADSASTAEINTAGRPAGQLRGVHRRSPGSRPLRLALGSHNIHGSSITPALFIGRHPSCLKLACIRDEIAGW